MGNVDNALVEAFWARMQAQLLNRKKWRPQVELANAKAGMGRMVLPAGGGHEDSLRHPARCRCRRWIVPVRRERDVRTDYVALQKAVVAGYAGAGMVVSGAGGRYPSGAVGRSWL